MSESQKKVLVLMGSTSDAAHVEPALTTLDELGIEYSVEPYSAHRTPEKVVELTKGAPENNVGVIIAAAGGAAHLPGVIASHTVLPVIGIPIPTSMMGGMDSLLSIVQMPGGIPVATVGANSGGAVNAALLAAQILAVGNATLTETLLTHRKGLAQKVEHRAQEYKASR